MEARPAGYVEKQMQEMETAKKKKKEMETAAFRCGLGSVRDILCFKCSQKMSGNKKVGLCGCKSSLRKGNQASGAQASSDSIHTLPHYKEHKPRARLLPRAWG